MVGEGFYSELVASDDVLAGARAYTYTGGRAAERRVKVVKGDCSSQGRSRSARAYGVVGLSVPLLAMSASV